MIVERKNRDFVTLAVVIQKATSTTGMTAGDEAWKHFQDFIKNLSGEQ